MDEARISIASCEGVSALDVARALDAAPPGWQISFDDGASSCDVFVSCDPAVQAPVRFDPSCPGSLVPDIAAHLATRRVAAVTAVVGATGGAGTSTVALHLTRHLARGAAACVVESEVACGTAERLGLDTRPTTWAHSNDHVLEVAQPFPDGVRALFAPDPAEKGGLVAAIARARDAFDRVVVDAHADVLDLDVLSGDDAVVVVVPPTRTGCVRARSLLDRIGVRCAVITNRLGPGSEMTRGALEKVLECPIALELPCCPALRDAEDRATLLDRRRRRWSVRLGQLAAAVVSA